MTTVGRREFLAVSAASILAAPAFAQSTGEPDPKLIDDLVAANRILADQGVVDGFGHVSVRHDKRPDRFLISRTMAPGLVTSADIMELDLDGAPIDARGRTPYLERFIHAEIFRARPDVGAVVHSHSPGVIPFTAAKTPLRAVYHMASFLGEGVPVFEIRTTSGLDSDMLIRDSKLGKALAATLANNTVVLLRGHGAVAVGDNVKTAVMHAIYTEIGAKAQAEAMRLGPVTYLNRAEAEKITKQNDTLVDRPWELWRAKAMGK